MEQAVVQDVAVEVEAVEVEAPKVAVKKEAAKKRKTEDCDNEAKVGVESLMCYSFTLEKAAKSSGGDKFVCQQLPEWSVYFPQAISRPSGASKPRAKITVQVSSS